MKIHLCMPAFGNLMHIGLMGNLLSMYKEINEAKDQFTFSYVSTSLISFNRNYLMETAKDADYVLMWDADIQVISRQFIYKMIDNLQKNKAQLLGLIVRMKSSDLTTPVYCCGFKKGGKYVKIGALPHQPIEVDFTGAGITLLDNKWMRANIEEPFYEIKDLKGPTMIPEDWMLCDKIKSKGGRIIADPTIGTIHYGQYGWTA